MSDFKVGDWVAVTGPVVQLHPNGVDVGVEVVAADGRACMVWADGGRCYLNQIPERPDPVLPEEPPVGSVVLVTGLSGNVRLYQRFRAGWMRPGPPEVFTWQQLHACGEVRVVHHG